MSETGGEHSGETGTAPAVERLTLSALVDGGTTALLQTDDHCEVRIPIFLLPKGAGIGSVLRMALTLDNDAHRERVNQVGCEREPRRREEKRKEQQCPLSLPLLHNTLCDSPSLDRPTYYLACP
jgi:hypothetical protein